MGGGSGGHVTPVLAVNNELSKLRKDLEVRFWCDSAYAKRAKSLFRYADTPVKVQTVRAGKLRRYNATALWKQLLDIPTVVRNFIDIFIVFIGFIQSFFRLLLWRPSVIFLKGGFVCLPVGYAAMLLRIPYVIHDSDAHPGLTNRLLAPYARMIATGSPLEYYHYPEEKARYVGIPVQSSAHTYSVSEKQHLKKLLKVPENEPLVVVTGGGLGAKRINDAMVAISDSLLKRASVIHLSGVWQYQELTHQVPRNDRYKLISFVDNTEYMAQIIAAADVVVTRAGATSMAELAAVGATTIIVPNAQLTGGHQVKNAKVFSDAEAAVVVDELQFGAQPQLLLDTIIALLDDTQKRQLLGQKLMTFSRPDAALEVAKMIQQTGKL